jgi:hypothetical protein
LGDSQLKDKEDNHLASYPGDVATDYYYQHQALLPTR